MKTQQEKCEEFSLLHQSESAFIIPNPWDVGSAKLLQGLGFKALATTSAGLAYSLGRPDGEVSLEQKLEHCRGLSKNTTIPISADFENGFSSKPDAVAKNVLALAETGVAGCSIEDFDRDTEVIYDFNLAVERVQATAEALASLGMPFQLTARAENLLRGVDDIENTIKRLQAFESAGANVVYAPGITSLEQLKIVTAELKAPFNVLAPFIKGASLKDFSNSGAKRVSIGGALTFAAASPILEAGNDMLQGKFDWVGKVAPRKLVDELLAR